MEWVLRSPQIHSTFGNLGFVHSDGYHINENCNAFLETILNNIKTEDKYLRTYRRNISFGRNIEKDLIPLLIYAKDEKTIELLVKILVNLTIPVECLLSIVVVSKNDFGRHTIFEINNLLISTKEAFKDLRTTRVLISFMKKNIESEQNGTKTIENRTNICNSLLLLRNILHIPEDNSNKLGNYPGSSHCVQNQIVWNLFSQSIDKILIKLMTIPDAHYWGVTMVQLIALFYKDQHVIVLQKLLNAWLDSSLSESSLDNESNTSPPGRGSDDSSPMLTSDPTSDSSDTGASGKSNDELNSIVRSWRDPSSDCSGQNSPNNNHNFKPEDPLLHKNNLLIEVKDRVGNITDDSMKFGIDTAASSRIHLGQSDASEKNGEKKTMISEISDCGYGTQIENQESVSTETSSNDDEPRKKPVHQKPHNRKQRVNTKVRFGTNVQDRKRKKVSKRGKSNIINVQGLAHNTPTDDDIANVLKEFTVDFLLKGYNMLVRTLHNEILTNLKLEIDTSHFFWLVTYFLKFASQIELDLIHLNSVLTYDIVSYLTAEGVNLCEQFDLAIKVDGSDLTSNMRRLHLVVTSIRELVQAILTYEKCTYLKMEDRELLIKLQIKMCETAELRSLLVLLLGHYNSRYHSKQYLQDLIVTNHILLMFLDNVMRSTDYNFSANMTEHIQQFATPKIMHQYGVLLEDYTDNGQFVNDCIFTIMHHVSGEVDNLVTLFQPKILSSFSSILQSDFEICDDWSDLIQYVMNTFIKKPGTLNSTVTCMLKIESFEEEIILKKVPQKSAALQSKVTRSASLKRKADGQDCNTSTERWTKEEISSLGWLYVQCKNDSDSDSENISKVIQLLKDDGIHKSRDSVIRELYKQSIINNDTFEKLTKAEGVEQNNDVREEEISKLREQLSQDGKSVLLQWVQGVLLDICQVKIYLEKRKVEKCEADETKLLKFELFKKKVSDIPVMSPVAYHSLILGRSVPLVTWNCKQASIYSDLILFQLLHKLGFHMPVDTGKIFIRIPHFWTADFLFEVAEKLWPVDKSKLNFCLSDLLETNTRKSETHSGACVDINKNVAIIDTHDNLYQVHTEKHLATMVNFTPMPGCSFKSEANEVINDNQNWLKVIQKSQELEISLTNLGSFKEDVVMMAPADAAVAPPGEAAAYSAHIADGDCNSECETASVASDLTRMYVSDEDERSERARPERERRAASTPLDSNCNKRPKISTPSNTTDNIK